MKTYDTYKDSGIDWLGKIPEHWECKKMKYLFYDISIKNKPLETLLSVTQNQGVVPREWVENRMVMPSGNLESFKFIEKGDFCISLRSFEGGLEYCFHSGIVSPAYTVLKGEFNHFDGYYKYLFKSKIFIDEMQLSIVGIREGKNISYELLKYSHLPLPPISEQEAIARFLDDKCGKIDDAVRIKEQQIVLLKEHRQITIHNAVTKGIPCHAEPAEASPKLKNSGIDWIGDIPEHWEVKPNRYIFNLKKNQVGRRSSEYELLSLTLRGVIKRDMNNPEGKFPTEFDTYQEVKKGDFIFCLFDVEETPRTVGLSSFDGMITGAYTVFSITKTNNGKFLYYYYLNADSKKLLKYLYRGLRNTIPKESFYSLKTAIPPISKQEAIVSYLDVQTAKIDQAIAQKTEQITKLKEYKQSLINEVVTGKVRVS